MKKLIGSPLSDGCALSTGITRGHVKRLAVMMLSLILAQAVHSATMVWGTTVLADTSPNGYYYPPTGGWYANPGTDVYLIYNGINNSAPLGEVSYLIGAGLQFGGILVAQYTTDTNDFYLGWVNLEENVPGLNWLGETSADWDAMNDRVFSIIAVSDDDGDYASGAYYGVYTGNAINFAIAIGGASIGNLGPPVLDAGAALLFVENADINLFVESAYGSPIPDVGANGYFGSEAVVTCFVDSPASANGTNAICIGWTGTGDIPATGSTNTTGEITLTQDSSVTWNWLATEYWLDVTVIGSGSLNISNCWHPIGTNITVTVTPDAGWLFMGWSGDLSGDHTVSNTNLLMDGAKTVIATFSDDADGDGLSNTEEDALGTDSRDVDTDNDLISDYLEVVIGLNPLFDNTAVDSDTDGLLDVDEVLTHNTDPLDDDTDDDGALDGDELIIYGTDPLDEDTDDDYILDGDELANGLDPLTSNSGLDSDFDNLSDLSEVNYYGTNPLSTDTDGDWLDDYAEINIYGTNPTLADTDGDGLSDDTELFVTQTSPFNPDSDEDGLSDGVEVNIEETDPTDSDTDNDGLMDGDEIIIYFTDPLNRDTDYDGLTDSEEVNIYFTNPADADTDNDGASDGDEVHIHGTDPNDSGSDADHDNDGIDDVWEMAHFGGIESCNPFDDPDGDLYTNIEEFYNGSDPNAFGVYLMHAAAIEFWFKTVSGVVYQIQVTPNVNSGVWNDIGDPIIGDGQTHYIFKSTRSVPNKAFRVITLP